MAIYDLISENDESTVVAEFEQGFFSSEAPYMSERNLEDQFVAQLGMQEYEYLPVSTEDELIANLRKQLELLNGVTFNDGEWKRFFTTNIAKPNSSIVEKTRVIQEDPRFTFTFDNGDIKNIMLLDIEDILHDQNDINENTRLQLDAISTALAVLGFAACYQRDARTSGRASPTAPTQADRIHTT